MPPLRYASLCQLVVQEEEGGEAEKDEKEEEGADGEEEEEEETESRCWSDGDPRCCRCRRT